MSSDKLLAELRKTLTDAGVNARLLRMNKATRGLAKQVLTVEDLFRQLDVALTVGREEMPEAWKR